MGAFDDLIPSNTRSKNEEPGGGAFSDLIPKGPKGNLVGGGFETAATVGTGMLASALGGLAGIGAGLSKMAGITDVEPANVVQDIQQRLTYQPRTEMGQKGVQAVGQVATLGGLVPKLGELAGEATLGVTGSPLAATAADVAAQSIPQILGAKGAALAIPKAAQAAGAIAGAAERTVSPLFERFISKAPEAEMPGVGAAEASAQTQRLARMQGLPEPIQPTEGQLSRSFEQQQFERETAKLPGIGEPIRQRNAEQNAQLLKNFDIFSEQAGGTAPDLIAVGKSVDQALSSRMARVKNMIDQKYRIAEEKGAMDQPIDVTPLTQFLSDKAPESINAPILESVGQKLVKFGAAEKGPEGQYIPTGNSLPIKTLEEIRKMINDVGGDTPSNQRMSAQTKGVIDSLTEGQGGELYRDARNEYRKYASEFQNQSAVARMMATKPGTADRAIAYEDVWQKAVPGDYSVQDLRNLRVSLFKEGPKGAQAWKDLGSATIDYLKQQATRTAAMDEAGNPIVGAAGMRNALKSIGRDKLDLLFTKNGASKLYDLSAVIDDLKLAPPGSVNTSNTAATLIGALTEAGLTGAVTGVPVPVGSAIKFAIQGVRNKKLRQRVEQALNPNVKFSE